MEYLKVLNAILGLSGSRKILIEYPKKRAPRDTAQIKYIKPLIPVRKGSKVTRNKSTVYKRICTLVNSRPWVTGNIGISAFLYSSLRWIAKAQKCGGVHIKTIRKRRSAYSMPFEPATAVHPRTGGAAPAAPPITIFCGVALFKYMV